MSGAAPKGAIQGVRSQFLMRIRNAIGRSVLSDRVGHIASALLRGRIPHRGLVIDTNSPLVSDAVRVALLFGAYESAEQRFVRRHVPASVDVIELGSSIGVMTCILRQQIDFARRLLSVEADARLIPLVRKNLATNAAAPVELINAAIDYSGATTVDFAIGENSLGGAVGGRHPVKAPVATARLADLVTRLGTTRYAVVSDVEGAEWDIWKHDQAALKGAVICVFELHDALDGRPVSDLITAIATNDEFELLDRYGNVVVFRGKLAE